MGRPPMRNEASLRRLVELGIDVYLPRGTQARGAVAAAIANAGRRPATAGPARVGREAGDADENHSIDVVVLAQAMSKPARTLVADVMRALRCAGVVCVHAGDDELSALATASAVVMFGEARVRAAGALVPAQRQTAIGWVVSADLAALVGDADGKRALWSELRRTLRRLAAQGEPARR